MCVLGSVVMLWIALSCHVVLDLGAKTTKFTPKALAEVVQCSMRSHSRLSFRFPVIVLVVGNSITTKSALLTNRCCCSSQSEPNNWLLVTSTGSRLNTAATDSCQSVFSEINTICPVGPVDVDIDVSVCKGECSEPKVDV